MTPLPLDVYFAFSSEYCILLSTTASSSKRTDNFEQCIPTLLRMGMQGEFRVALVTGGAYGIGRATVRCFASHGDAVVIADRDAERGQVLESALRSEGRRRLRTAGARSGQASLL